VLAVCRRRADRRAVATAMVDAFADADVLARAFQTAIGRGARICSE
jgi:homoserine kinase